MNLGGGVKILKATWILMTDFISACWERKKQLIHGLNKNLYWNHVTIWQMVLQMYCDVGCFITFLAVKYGDLSVK